jgi:predicted lipoprotein with Yx(FWY)xxD motif
MNCSSSQPRPDGGRSNSRITGAAFRARALARPALAALVTAVAASACGSSAAPSAASTAARTGAGTVTIEAKSLPQVGTVLINAGGYALYMFVPDDQRQVTCTSLCAQTWPPVRIKAGATLAAGPGVRQDLLGSDTDPAGGRVVTYNGWPLYAYTGDVYAGQTTGQGIDLNGGDWYLLRPSGQLVKTVVQ